MLDKHLNQSVEIFVLVNMKYLPLILLFNITFAQSQELEEKSNSAELKQFYYGVYAHHIFNNRFDQQYRINTGYNDSELTNKSFSQAYTLNLGYSFKNAFTKISIGTAIDYINVKETSSSQYGDYSPSGVYYTTSSSNSTTKIIDRNRSFCFGAEIGGFVKSNSRFKVGGSISLDYTHYYSNRVLDNNISGSYSSSYNNPGGSGSSSGTFKYDNQSSQWNSTVQKINSAFLSPRINLLLSYRISDQFFLEFQAGQRFSFTLNNGNLNQLKVQFPMGIGFKHHIF